MSRLHSIELKLVWKHPINCWFLWIRFYIMKHSIVSVCYSIFTYINKTGASAGTRFSVIKLQLSHIAWSGDETSKYSLCWTDSPDAGLISNLLLSCFLMHTCPHRYRLVSSREVFYLHLLQSCSSHHYQNIFVYCFYVFPLLWEWVNRSSQCRDINQTCGK